MKFSLTYFSNAISQTLFFVIVVVTIIGCETNRTSNIEGNVNVKDSAVIFLQIANNKDVDIAIRKEFLYKAYSFNKNQKKDSIKNNNLLKISFQAFKLKDTTFFIKGNNEAREFSIKIGDTLILAETYWNEAIFYLEKEKMDLAFYNYYQAYKNYDQVNHEYYAAKMLYNMGFIQARIKDYTGSEISTFKAITKFNKLDKYLNLYRSYNQLGSVFKDLKEFDKAIFYHKKSLEYLKTIKNKNIYLEGSLNDIGMVYQNQGNYNMALEYFDRALDNKELEFENIWHYARLIDNVAYTKFLLGDTTNLLTDYNIALHIKDSLLYVPGIIISKFHLAEFYAVKEDTIRAIGNAKQAKELALQLNNNRDILRSLLLLSKIDKGSSSAYLEKYVALSDSLQIEERKLRGKFTRIRFETDEYKEETEKLSQQKIIIASISVIAVLFFILLYYLKVQHAKNNALLYEKEQQIAKEEIYELMIKQQSKLEEGRLNERHRISEDLHDGVLGKLFGTRLSLGFLDVKGDSETIIKHSALIDELQTIEKEIRTISHELKNEMFSSEISFIDLVEHLIENQSKIGNFTYSVFSDTHIKWDKINENIKINCYRIIQEAIQNINKYAEASMVKIDFNLNHKSIKLIIKDNGIGFDKNNINGGIGLKNMESRALKFNGDFFVDSVINEGTTLVFIIPV